MQSSGQSLWTSAIHTNISQIKLNMYTCLSLLGYIQNEDKWHLVKNRDINNTLNVVDNTIHEYFVDK